MIQGAREEARPRARNEKVREPRAGARDETRAGGGAARDNAPARIARTKARIIRRGEKDGRATGYGYRGKRGKRFRGLGGLWFLGRVEGWRVRVMKVLDNGFIYFFYFYLFINGQNSAE